MQNTGEKQIIPLECGFQNVVLNGIVVLNRDQLKAKTSTALREIRMFLQLRGSQISPEYPREPLQGWQRAGKKRK